MPLVLKAAVPDDPGAVRRSEPFTAGVPLPAGFCRDEHALALAGPNGRLPVQATALDRWPDGSLRWVLLDFRAPVPGALDVEADPAPGLQQPQNATADRFCAGALEYRVHRTGAFGLHVRDNTKAASARTVRIELTRADGRVVQPEVRGLEWELRGPVRSVLRVDAAVAAGGRQRLDVSVRLHFRPDLPVIMCELALTNPSRARHPGGLWELGDGGSVFFRDCSVIVTTGTGGTVRWSADCADEAHAAAVPWSLYQDSSGGGAWRSRAHVDRHGAIPQAFRGYRISGVDAEGRRATPVVWTETGSGLTAVAMRHFWQNAPKAIEADASRIVLRLFPAQFAGPHELQGGERKTHVFHLAFAADGVSATPLDWARRPALACASPDWYTAVDAAPYLVPLRDDPHAEHVALVSSIIDGPHSFAMKREVVDEYGWRHFGDVYADHEGAPEYYRGAAPIVSHYNNQYDAVAGFARQFLRSGDPRWWAAMDELAAHVRDIDIYHTDADKPAYSGGMFWHTCHYVDAGRSSHRSYPASDGVQGGGPSNEHVYSTGLMLHYFLTGDRSSRDAAVGLADWLLRADDGGGTPLRWLSRTPTGLASKTLTLDYNGPGRGAGNAINVLMDGFRLTADRRYLAKAEELVSRCIHPADDLSSGELLDAGRRWSYTVFLQALGRYLDDKRLTGECDRSYVYARESLLHYARWMADHEYLYLERPGTLEYPTETWSAQDVRKSDVLHFAAMHATPPERERFRERAASIFSGAIRMLAASPTRHTARARVILCTSGALEAVALVRGYPPVPQPAQNGGVFPTPSRFVPQKLVALRRLRALGAAGAIAATALVWVLIWL